MAQKLGKNSVVLMRGHGFSAAADGLLKLVRMSVYLPRNARILLAAMRMGEFKALSENEIKTRNNFRAGSPEMQRGWEFWAKRAGCGDMLKSSKGGVYDGGRAADRRPFPSDPAVLRGHGLCRGLRPAIGRYPDWSPELALEVMDQFEVATALMSLGQPGVQFCKPAEAKTLARRCNDYSAELNAKHGKRFGAFGTVSMWNVADAVEEVGYCLDTLKFSGVSLFASYDGKFLGDAQFDPVMEALNARDGVVFVHPGAHPANKQIDLPWPYFMMEYLFDTTRAVVNLMFGGALERYPRIRFILPHAGGLVPYFSWRLSVSPMIDKRLKQMSQEKVFELLKRFWYDNALSPGAQTWGCLENVAAPDQIVFGTDWPFANVHVTAAAMKTYESLDAISPAQRAAIDRGNALRLFPQLA